MTESTAQTPEAPKRKPTLLERILAWLPKLHHTPETVQPLFTCSHRYANGASAWSACWWSGSAWITRCAICGTVAYCR